MKSKLLNIKAIITDVDGVMTDGSIIYSASDGEIKYFNVQDGMGITLCRMAGLKTGIITGRDSHLVRKRAEELKIDFLSQGSFNKLPEYEAMKANMGLDDSEICYIGDDLLDLPLLLRVGYSVTVADGRDEVKAVCDYITMAKGGQGAVREVIDKILRRQGKLETILSKIISGKFEKP